jgi:hypothetical protein
MTPSKVGVVRPVMYQTKIRRKDDYSLLALNPALLPTEKSRSFFMVPEGIYPKSLRKVRETL